MTLRIVAGKFKGRTLKAPKSNSTRPTQGMLREAVFNICQMEVPDTRFLDLFAGSGAMGLEALSRGASHSTFVEQNRQAAACIRENIATLELEAQTTIIPTDATRAIAILTKQSAQFDIVYIDPPYDTPFPVDTLLPILAPNALIFLEERHNPKKAHTIPSFPKLIHKDTRRFGIALLTTFRYNG